MFCIDNRFFGEAKNPVNAKAHNHQAGQQDKGPLLGEQLYEEIIFRYNQNGKKQYED